MDKIKSQVWDVLCGLSGETVVQLLTDWHGTDLIGEEFAEFLSDEGYMDYEADDEEIEEDDEDEAEVVRVYNIKWDCDDDEKMLDSLPTEIDVKVPIRLVSGENELEEEFLEYISDAIIDQEGYRHFSFEYEIVEY